MENKSNKKKIAIIVGLIAVLIIIGVSVFTLGSDGRALKKQLDLGYKFLTEQEYEQAIATFKKAIEIDPMSVDAYLGLADAYVGKGDLEIAKSTLEDAIKFFEENGQDATALKDKHAEVQAEIDRIVAERKTVEVASGTDSLQLKALLESIDIYGESVLNKSLDELVSKYSPPTASYKSRADIIDTFNPDSKDHFYYFIGDEDNSDDLVIWRVDPRSDQNYDLFYCLSAGEEYLSASGNSIGPVSEITGGLTNYWRQSGCSTVVDLLKYLGLSFSDDEWNSFLSGKEMLVDTDMEKGVTMYYEEDSFFEYEAVGFYGHKKIWNIFLKIYSEEPRGKILEVIIYYN